MLIQYSCSILLKSTFQGKTLNDSELLFHLCGCVFSEPSEARYQVRLLKLLSGWILPLGEKASMPAAVLPRGTVLSHLITQTRRGWMSFLVGNFWSSDFQSFLICELWKHFRWLLSLLGRKLKLADKRLVLLALTDPFQVGCGCHRSSVLGVLMCLRVHTGICQWEADIMCIMHLYSYGGKEQNHWKPGHKVMHLPLGGQPCCGCAWVEVAGRAPQGAAEWAVLGGQLLAQETACLPLLQAVQHSW